VKCKSDENIILGMRYDNIDTFDDTTNFIAVITWFNKRDDLFYREQYTIL